MLTEASPAEAKKRPSVAIDERNPRRPCIYKLGRRCVKAIPDERIASSTKQLDRMRIACAAVRPARNVGARSQLMSTVPGFRRQLQDGQGFKLTGSSGPGIEKVAAPPARSNEHIRGPGRHSKNWQVFDRNGLPLKRRHAAINDEFRAQHESGFRRRQIKNSGSNLLRRTKAFDRDLALNPILGFLNFFLGSISQKR